jgi:REP element-mobilizing transposase RayT
MQLLLSPQFKLSPLHGGSLSVGKRKAARPIATRRPMHVVLRSTSKRLVRHAGGIRRLLKQLGHRYQVTVYERSVNSNHIHLVVRAKTRMGFHTFLRVFAGQVAQKITKRFKGTSLKTSFWEFPPFTRILEWGKAFLTARQYVLQNQLEADGVIPYQPRKRKKGRLAG